LYKLQYVNVHTQEILREQDYETKEVILSIIDSFERAKNSDLKSTCYIFDYRKRTLDAEFTSFNTYRDDDGTFVYRLFFKVKMAEVQAIIR